MDINPNQANSLCKLIIEKLTTWRAFDAALQEGGFEQKAAGRVEIGLYAVSSGI